VTITNLIAALRLDLGDPSGELLGDVALRRALERAVPLVSADMGVAVAVVGEGLSPVPDSIFHELLLLRAQAFSCSMLRAMTARNFSFKSGDKEVDKTKQADWWAKQERDLLDDYQARVEALKPGDPQTNVTPLIYEVESVPRDEF
jgi:hypothetical protein